MYFEGQDYICGKRIVSLNVNIFIDANFLGGTFLEVRVYCRRQNCVKYKRHIVQADFQVKVPRPRSFEKLVSYQCC